MDPGCQSVFDFEQSILEKFQRWNKLPNPVPSSHLWTAKLPTEIAFGTHPIEVWSTDMHGRVYRGQRVIRIA